MINSHPPQLPHIPQCTPVTRTHTNAASSLTVRMAPQTRPKLNIKGPISATCTPYKANGDVNLDMIGPYVDHLVEFGVHHVFLTGCNGEGYHLTVAERKAAVEAWIKHGRGKLTTMIVHVGTANIRDTQELARHAQAAGADAVACMCPFYFKPPTTEELVAYMQEVAKEAPKLPFLLYDYDVISGIKLNVNDFFHAAKDRIPNLAGCKHSSNSFQTMQNILHDHGDTFTVLMGCDEQFLEGLSIGLQANVIVGSYYGHVFNRLQEAFEKGDLATARKEQARIVILGNLGNKYGLSGPNECKVPMNAICGLDMGQCRLPCAKHTPEQVEGFRKDLKAIGFFDWGMKK